MGRPKTPHPHSSLHLALRNARFSSRIAFALSLACLAGLAVVNVISIAKNRHGDAHPPTASDEGDIYLSKYMSRQHRSPADEDDDGCVDPLWCAAEPISAWDLLALRRLVAGAASGRPLDLEPAPLPSLELVNSVVGRDVGPDLACPPAAAEDGVRDGADGGTRTANASLVGPVMDEACVENRTSLFRQTFLVADGAVEVSSYLPPFGRRRAVEGTGGGRLSGRRTDEQIVARLMKGSDNRRVRKLCSRDTSVVLLVISGRENFKKRAVIRASWANATDVRRRFPPVSLVFVIGDSVTSAAGVDNRVSRNASTGAGGGPDDNNGTAFAVEDELAQLEADKFRDSVFLNETDVYRNLTYKVLSGYQWALKHCPGVEVIGKVDDDIYLDVPGTLNAINRYLRKGEMATLGVRTPDDAVVKIEGHVHYVDYNQYAFPAYPYSMRGMAYYVTKSYAAVLLAASFGRKPLGLDDKYITGIWARKLGARQIFLNSPEGDYAMNCEVLLKWVSDETGKRPLPMASLCLDQGIHRMAHKKFSEEMDPTGGRSNATATPIIGKNKRAKAVKSDSRNKPPAVENKPNVLELAGA